MVSQASTFPSQPLTSPQLTASQGENVVKKEPIRSSFYKTYRKDPGRAFTVVLLQCHDAIAPTRRTANVITLCEIKCTIDKPYSAFDDFVNNKGERLKKFSYELEMVPSGAAVEFVVYFDGKKQGTQNAKIVFQ